MPIDTEHAEYREHLPDWKRMRDVLAGQRAMRASAGDYIRRPAGMTDADEWAGYVLAAPFFEATLRTQEGLTGLAFYREPEIKLPPALDEFAKDATQDGVPFRQFTEAVFEEVLGFGRVGVFVDFPKKDPKIKSRLDEERAKRRPFVRRYNTEAIFYWETTVIDGAIVLSEVRMHEVETEKVNEWDSRWRRVIRVLQLVKAEDGTHFYQQRRFVHRRWQDIDGVLVGDEATGNAAPDAPAGVEPETSWVADGDPVIPVINGKPLPYIPFWFVNPTDQSPAVRRSPMLGLANANVSHFNTSAMLENALYWCGNPQPWIAGVDPSEVSGFVIGSSAAWVFKDPNTKVEMLSYGAGDIDPLEKRLDKIERNMAVMGARMIAQQRVQVEAAETARIHQQGEISVLAGVCGSVSRTMTDVAQVAADWMEAEEKELIVKIQTAFFDGEITLSDALQAVKLWQAGFMTVDDVIALMKKGQFVKPDATAESIQAENESSPIQPIMDSLTPGSGGTRPPGTSSPPAPPTPPRK